MKLAKVVVDLPLLPNESFYYSIPDEIKDTVKPGTIVHIPFGRQELNGYVLDILSKETHQAAYKIKPIYNVVYKNQIWDKKFFTLAQWISEHYLTNIGTVLSASASSDIFKDSTRTKKKDVLQEPTISTKKLVLNKEQEHAFNTILNTINKEEHEVFLLHGVTGSGKTEVYLNLIDEVLKKGKTVICLVPEIYLVPQAYERLSSRFNPSSVIIWHSSLTKSERWHSWQRLQTTNEKNEKIILGARSAILSPIKNVGLIVIDEAHDASYKQISPSPRYNTIKVAIKRGEIENCPVILGTATPNITDYHFCDKYHTVLELPNRIENYPMPKVEIVDLRNEYQKSSKSIISGILRKNIEEALSKKEQVILLLNRRGYSSHIFCRSCGYIQYCKNCSVPLVFHKNTSLMICHHCGYSKAGADLESSLCPNCHSPHFQYFGLGTQQLEEEVKKIFKDAKTIRIDSDQLKGKNQYIKLWQEFSSHKADILIGTQLVSKGIDLPNITVVGVILADTMLNFPDYISYERAFQLLTQVTGRTGRGKKPGKVFIQTYQTENPIFKFIKEHDYKSFYHAELKQREELLYPPFSELTRIIFQSYNETECLDYAQKTLKELEAVNDKLTSSQIHPFYFLGPAPCFFAKLHGKYRYHILCKMRDEHFRQSLFNTLFQKLNKNAKVDLILDVDSVNLL